MVPLPLRWDIENPVPDLPSAPASRAAAGTLSLPSRPGRRTPAGAPAATLGAGNAPHSVSGFARRLDRRAWGTGIFETIPV
jgi:hypothetical protein